MHISAAIGDRISKSATGLLDSFKLWICVRDHWTSSPQVCIVQSKPLWTGEAINVKVSETGADLQICWYASIALNCLWSNKIKRKKERKKESLKRCDLQHFWWHIFKRNRSVIMAFTRHVWCSWHFCEDYLLTDHQNILQKHAVALSRIQILIQRSVHLTGTMLRAQ